MFSPEDLQKGLRSKHFGKKIYTFESIDSTNNCAKVLASCDAPHGTVVITEEQTAGRGRLGRSWLAQPGENLTFSIVLRPDVPVSELNLLPLFAAVSLAEAIEQTTGIEVDCKWPNDILTREKKLVGILLEGSFKSDEIESVVLGIGVNVNQTIFPEEIKDKATSLRLEGRRKFDRVSLLQDLLFSLEDSYIRYSRNGFQSVIPQWMLHTSMIEKRIEISQNGEIIAGEVRGISADGGLIIDSGGVEKAFFAGDVTIVG